MQLLYSIETIHDRTDKKDPVKTLHQLVEQTKELYVYLLFYITEVARYAEKDAKHRAAKNIPSAADLNVSTKIVGNETLWSIVENATFRSALEEYKPSLNEEGNALVKKTYQKLLEDGTYLQYIAAEGRIKKSETAILEHIFTDVMLNDEDFLSFAEENFQNWDDDAEMLSLLIVSALHKPNAINIKDLLPTETWQYGRQLLNTVVEKKEYLNGLIKPKLKNWELDRIALIDIELLQMGVAELLYFETIPPKVTINEYIDIAKEYSTEQSGQFVNGILDGLRKDLEKEGKINKIEFRKN